MQLSPILSRTWRLVRRYKSLWAFGLLASCSLQTGYVISASNFLFVTPQIGDPGGFPFAIETFFINLGDYLSGLSPDAVASFTLAAVTLFVTLSLLVMAASVYGRLSLIKAARLADAEATIYWGLLLKQAFEYFFRGLGLNLLLSITLLSIPALLTIIGVLFGLVTIGMGFIVLAPFLCLLTPLTLIFKVFIQLANIALVHENLSISKSVRRAWHVLTRSWRELINPALLFTIFGGFLSTLISLPISFAASPILLAALSGQQNLVAGGFVIAILCLIIGLPIMLLANSILRALLESAWAFSYIEATSS